MENKGNLIKILDPSLEKQHILRNQVIDDNGPGTILPDFKTLLNFIGQQGIKVSGKYNFITLKLLSQINAQMTHPVEIDLKRPIQKSYPYINGLYLLVRASGLAVVTGSGTNQKMTIDNEVLESWETLNPTERYFTLLETWLLKGREEIIKGSRGGGYYTNPFMKWERFFERIADKGLKIAGNKEQERDINYVPGLYTIALLDLFGLISLKHAKPEKGKGWRIAEVHRTPLGDALLTLLSKYFIGKDYIESYINESEVIFGVLQPLLQPFFPEKRKNLIIPEHKIHDGLYVFKVFIGRAWRRIVIPGQMNLDVFSAVILDAFDFDHDHLYMFSCKNRFGILEHVNHPYTEEPPFTNEVIISKLPINPGNVMTFLFDFGDNWEFDVKLERIDPPDPKIKQPVVT
ncbi:MAG: plasmid pRiA4b ORF-3 family protein, partial [Deltaproteobacteria bacterium]|nr:plasmid pRiA4b ORF-3 family protein [Deltaproteobacteria bacterium]